MSDGYNQYDQNNKTPNSSNSNFNHGSSGNVGFNSGSNNSSSYSNSGGNNFRFKRKVDTSEGKLYKPYCVVANQNPPDSVIEAMIRLVAELEEKGYVTRVGGLKPIEERSRNQELYLPFKGFDGQESKNYFSTTQALDIARMFSPTWENLKPVIHAFQGRNVRMVLGDKLKSPAVFVLCWSQDGAERRQDRNVKTGNIGHLIAIANAMHIPVFNFGAQNTEQRLKQFLEL